MTMSNRVALLCAASAFLVLIFVAPLMAAQPWDGPAFSADPKALLAAAEKVQAGNASLALLLDEGAYTFEADGRSRLVSHHIELVVTADGVERVGTLRVGWAPWYDVQPTVQARVIAKDGSVHMLDPKAVVEATAAEEPDMFSDERVLRAPLPGVTTGSIVETVITTESRSPIAGGGRFDAYSFQNDVPTETVRVILDSPASMTPHIVNKSKIEPRIVEKDGRKRIVFESGHSDAFTDWENFTPSDVMQVPYVAYSSGTSWQEIARSYSQIVDTQIAGSELKSVVAAAVGTATDRSGIITRLLAAIEKDVHYAGVEVGDGSIVPRSPKSVLANKYGDCKDKATLLVAMLRTAGIPAHVALLAAGVGFDVLPDLPGVNHFNHAIAVVDGSPALWIDPTDELARAGELPIEDQGRMALIAAPETEALTRTPEMASTLVRYVETRTFTLPEEGKAHVVEVTEGVGPEDALLRRGYASSDKKAYHDSMEKYAKAEYVAAAMEKLDVGEPHDLTKPFRVTMEIAKSLSGVVRDGDGAVAIPISNIIEHLPDLLRDYQEQTADAQKAAPAKKRVNDFLFPRPMVKEWIYRIVPPAGFVPRTLPANETTHLGTATLNTDYKTEADGTIVARLSVDTGKRRLTAAEFEETRMAMSKLERRDNVIVGFDSAGQARLNAGDIGAALGEFRRLAALHSREAQHHIEIARALLVGGLGEAARDEARRAITIEPSNARAYAMLAEVLEHDLLGRKLRRGCDLPAAITALRKAKELDPTEVRFRAELADLLTYGDGFYPFGNNAHLNDAIAEYKSLIKDLGKDGRPYEPALMLLYAHAGRWDDIKPMLDTVDDARERDIFRLLRTTVVDGSQAGIRELGAFDAQKRASYGEAVGKTLMALRMYPQAADFMEAGSKGTSNASNVLPLIQLLRKTKPVEQTIDDSPRSLIMKLMRGIYAGDVAGIKALFVPELAEKSEKETVSLNMKRFSGNDISPVALLDIIGTMIEVQPDGDDDTGYRLRMRMSGSSAGDRMTMFAEKRNGKYLIAAIGQTPDTIGAATLLLVKDGKLEAARTWLNWARQSITAGGGDDPLSGPPFARLWQKEKPAATADELRVAAASLMLSAEYAAEAAPVLASLREKATDEQKTSIDVALLSAYTRSSQWAKLLEIAEPLAKAHPDSGLAFNFWIRALNQSGRTDEADKVARERLARLPKDGDALRALTTISAKKGDYEAAESWARHVLDDLTPTANDYNEAAWIELYRAKDYDRAIEDARRASGEGAVSSNLHTLAALYAETGKSVEARQALMTSLDKRINDEPVSDDWFVLGRIAENYGVRDAALAAYKRVKKEDLTGLSTWELTEKRLAVLAAKK